MAKTEDMQEDRPLRLQSEKLLIEELPDDLMIFDPERNKAFCLNPTAAFVWKQANGQTPVSVIASRLERQSGKPVSQQVIWFALELLAVDGLLARDTILPPAVSGVTRRDLLQKIGVGAMALPMVTVLFVSPSRAHASRTAPSTAKNPTPLSAPRRDSGGFWRWLEDLF